MKKLLLFSLTFLSSVSVLTAQKDFKSKQKQSDGSKPKQQFEEINASKRNTQLFGKTVALHTKIIKDEETQAVSFASNPVFAKDVKNAKKSQAAMTFDFLGSLKNQLKINNPKDEFKIINETHDDLGLNHIRVQQYHKNVPIYGGEAILHSNKEGVIENLNGRVFPSLDINVSSNISPEDAIELALKDLKKTSIVQKSGLIGGILALEKDKAQLVIMPGISKSTLSYEVSVRPNMLERWVYFIDAKSGEIVDKYNHTCSLDGVVTASAKDLNAVTRSIKVTQLGNTYYMIDASKPMFNNAKSKLPGDPSGAIWTINAQNSPSKEVQDNVVQITSGTANNWNSTAVSAHFNASLSYDYYLNKFKRNSLNNNGGTVISIINIADDDGKGLDQAFWNGAFMGYGNGRDAFKPLAGALDVAGHEMTHGVIENTAKLEYRNQSGALNESFADVFGSLIDRDDWTLGEDVVKLAYFPSGALRSLENPNQGGKNDNGYQPKNMSQYANLKDTPEQDNGGVHINSGIPNHAYYKFATGAGMNKDKAEAVYYRVLTNYLTRTSKFTDLRLAVIQATTDLYGNGTEVNSAKAAFDFVGITDPGTTTPGTPGGNTPPTNTEIPVNPGTESLVVFDPRSSDQSLYVGPFNTNVDLTKATNGLGCLSKPSVTDDGSFAYFVGKDKKVYRLDLAKKSNPSVVSSEAIWRNVAISKNGKVLAALTSTLDNFIYIFDLVGNKSKKIKLFNPTYTAGVQTGEVLYADSFEWNYSGEYLIYDAFNQIKNISTQIEFWDVGILRAWDPVKNTFGDGSIEKMFTNLEEGENIGNPALAKTNTNIIAFDYFNSKEDAYYILGIDFSKSANNVSVITENNGIGFPDYSKNDKILVFNSEEDNFDVVKGVNLKADKITKDKEPIVFYTDAKWAVWFAPGQRALPTKQAQEVKVNAVADKLPSEKFDLVASSTSNLGLQAAVVSGDAVVNGRTVTCGAKPGKVVLRIIQPGDAKFDPAFAEVSFCIIPSKPSLLDQGLTVVASGGSGALYQFYVNGSPIGGQTANASLKKDFIGQYTVRAVTSDGCISAVSNTVGVAALGSETRDELKLVLSPNPATDAITVKMPENMAILKANIYSISGVKMLEFTENVVDITSLASGTYIIRVQSNEKELTGKFVKK